MAETPEGVTVVTAAGEIAVKLPDRVRHTIIIELDSPGGTQGTIKATRWIGEMLDLPNGEYTVVRVDVERGDT